MNADAQYLYDFAFEVLSAFLDDIEPEESSTMNDECCEFTPPAPFHSNDSSDVPKGNRPSFLTRQRPRGSVLKYGKDGACCRC